MSDEELTFEFMKRSTLEITAALMSFAEQTERFEANYEQAFSNFIENILGLAAISIAVPHTKVDCVSNDIGKLRTQLRENSKAMDGYVKGLHETQPRLSGVMLSANKRSIEALSKFIEHCDFGERMLREAEKLFDVGLKLGKR